MGANAQMMDWAWKIGTVVFGMIVLPMVGWTFSHIWSMNTDIIRLELKTQHLEEQFTPSDLKEIREDISDMKGSLGRLEVSIQGI